MTAAMLTPATTPALDTDFHLARQARNAVLAIGILGGSAFVLGTLVPFAGAVIGSGTVVIEGNVKKVQHQTGGTIGALLVKEGSVVREGDVVARLDATLVKSNLGIVMAELNTQEARVARLVSERDGQPVVTFPPTFSARAKSDPGAAAAMETERRMFESRRNAYEGQKSQLRERIGQAEKDIDGLTEQLRAVEKTQSIAERDRAMLEPLIRQGLVQRPRYTQLDREIERNTGAMGDTKARVENARTRIKEINVQIAQIDRDRLAEVAKDLRDAQAKIDEMSERRIGAEDQLQKADIKATASGVIHELQIHTIGGVVTAGESVMTIVPNPDKLSIEVRVAPTDKDRVKEGMDARVRFTSFNQRITPELAATVIRVSPKDSTDQRSGLTYFTVTVALKDGELPKLYGEKLVPGMLADTFITTDRRTMAEFLTKQFFDYIAHVARGR